MPPSVSPPSPAKRFRVAFSFSGKQRDFVVQVADLLAGLFGKEKILYDKYHEAEFARNRLGIYLPNLYHKESDLIVTVFCPHYETDWPGLEWTAIHDLLKQRREDDVMLCRFSHVLVQGLYSSAGFIELDRKTPHEAAALILERLAINEGQPKEYYTASLPASTTPAPAAKPLRTTVPNNLPRLQAFFGRDNELAVIREALDPESRTWGALIDGPGGMGKTSLAIRAALECTPEQFQRIIFVSIKDREMDDDGERKLGNLLVPGFLEMLNELARELGHHDIPKAAEDQRIRLLLDALRSARALLILDNLESLTKGDRDQLFNFVNRLPQGCKAILTSRRRIGSGSKEVILEKLSQEAALATLAELAKDNKLLDKTSEAERIVLYTQTAGKPLLLRWVAGQIGRGSCRTYIDALNFLRSCPPGNDPLEFVFGDLANEFTAEETQVLCALSYFTLPTAVKHIATVAEVKSTIAETALRSLTNRSLVTPDEEEQAYALVPLVADFLRHKQPQVMTETGNRLDKQAHALAMENGWSNHARFPVLDAAWPRVAAALPRFLNGDNGRLQEVCNALLDFLNFTGRWDEQLALSQEAEAKAVAAGNLSGAGWRAYQAGWVHRLRGQSKEVLDWADRAGAHWLAAKSGAREQAIAIRLRGIGHELAEDYPAAITAYREAVSLWQTLGPESEDVAIGLNNLAGAESLSGDYAAAERDYREALRIAKATEYHEGIAYITGNLAALALGRQDWPSAEVLAHEALPLSEKVGRQELIASDCQRLAHALARQSRPAEGLPYAQRAVAIFTRLGSPDLADAQAVLRFCEDGASLPPA